MDEYKLLPLGILRPKEKPLKKIVESDFVVIDGTVMLPQEVVAKYFDLDVVNLDNIISTLQLFDDAGVRKIIRRNRKYYFPSVDAVMVIRPFTFYANVEGVSSALEKSFALACQRLLGQKVYYKRSMPKKKTRSWSFFRIIVAISLILTPSCLGTSNESAPKETKVETQQSKFEAVAAPTVETSQSTTTYESLYPDPAYTPSDTLTYEGRGNDRVSALNYVGHSGYVSIAFNERHKMLQGDDFLYTPWQVPTYERDKQFWDESYVTLDHKTPVIVREQFLTQDRRYDSYEGYLLVERTNDGAQFYINVKNFITSSYWNRSDILQAVRGGCVLVEYHQRSDYWPVTAEDKKKVPPEGTILFATDTIGLMGKGWVQNSRHQISAFHPDYGYICFNKADLTLIY